MPKNTADPKLAIAYIRVSTDERRQELGAEAQRHAIEEWARSHGVTVGAWYVEECSRAAPMNERLVLIEALAAVGARGAGCLAVQRLDRFSGNELSAALACAELARHGATLACADGIGAGDDPASVMVRSILVAVAGFERAMISARIRAALAVKKRRGEFTGVAPYGMRAEGKVLVPDEREQSTIVRARELRASGKTIRAVAIALESEGHLNRAGKRFGTGPLHALLASE